MADFDSVDQVLDFAIDTETEAYRFYRDLAEQMENTAMHDVFRAFAREELGHKAKLEAMRTSHVLLTTGKVNDLKIADYLLDIKPKPDMAYSDVLIVAMQKEKTSFCLYMDLAEAIDNQAQREVFLSLAEEEARHKLRFEIEYDDILLKGN